MLIVIIEPQSAAAVPQKDKPAFPNAFDHCDMYI